MSDLKEVLTENSYLRQKQLIFADCDRYQRARVSTLLSIAAAVAGADYDARGLTYDKLYEMREVFLLSGRRCGSTGTQGPPDGGRHHLGGRGEGRPHAAGVRDLRQRGRDGSPSAATGSWWTQ